MSIVTWRNAIVGWIAIKLGKRAAKKQPAYAKIGAAAAAGAAAIGGVLFFWHHRRGDDVGEVASE